LSEVRTPLDGKEVAFRCTLRAAKEVNARFGSFHEAFRRMTTFDFDAYAAVVAAGLGKSVADVEEAVFRNGMPNLVKPLTDYLGMLSNGGRVPELAGEKKDDTGGNA
jgi:hypothetical protein